MKAKKAIFITILPILLLFYQLSPDDLNFEWLFYLLLFSGIITIIFILNNDKNHFLKGQFFKHSTFALLGLLIVNYQLYIDLLIGNIDRNDWFVWVNHSIVLKTLILSTIGLVCFFLGYLFYKPKKNNTSNNTKTEFALKTNFLFILALASLLIYFYTVNPLYLAGYYGSEDMGATATYMALLFQIFTMAIIIQKTRNLVLNNDLPKSMFSYIKKMGYPFLILIVIYLISVILSGDRGPIITFIVAYGSGYFFVTKYKMSFKSGVLMILIGASFFTILGIARSLDKNMAFMERIQESFKENPLDPDYSFLPQTKELATSVKATHHALDYVPSQHDFLYGRFQFQQLTTAIPFFSIINSQIFQDNSQKYAGSASFVTWIFQGDYPSYGNGTSVIADFYFDFGVMGVIVGMFFFGYYMRFSEIKMYLNKLPDLFSHAFFMVYISSAIYIARSSFLFEFRTVVWIFVILIFNKHIFNRKHA